MKGVFIFIGGVLTGVLATTLYVKKKLIPELRSEIYKECERDARGGNDIYADVSEGYSEDDKIQEIVVEPGITQNKRKEAPKPTMDYTGYFTKAELQKKGVKVEELNISKPESDKTERTDISGPGPYVIDASSFDEYSDYTARTFVFYSDGVVLEDEEEEILDADPKLVFGETALEELNKPENGGVVFVRNDETKSDYCLELRPYPFDGFDAPLVNDNWRE